MNHLPREKRFASTLRQVPPVFTRPNILPRGHDACKAHEERFSYNLSLLLKFEVNIKLYCAKFARFSRRHDRPSIVGCFLFISQRLNARSPCLANPRRCRRPLPRSPTARPTPISYFVFSISYLLLVSLRNFSYRDGRSPLSSIFRDSRNFLSLKIASTDASASSRHRRSPSGT